jgi:hypothetical protein
MKIHMFSLASLATALAVGALVAVDSRAASLTFVGSDTDLVNLYPGGTAPYVVVPWRSDIKAKAFDIDGNDVYGSDGYALFATQFGWPNPTGCCGASQPFASATYPNKIELPSYVSGSTNLVNNKVGGWEYSLIDDPALVNGYRDYNWGDTLAPPVNPLHSQSPYLKMGILDGGDIFGNDPKTAATGAGRWGFEIGANPPERIRVGVMTDGLDDVVWAATEVLLHQVSGNAIIDTATSGSVVRNRFVDIHSFDIVGAQPGDTFAIFAKAPATGLGNGAISGVTFDAVPEPASIAMIVCMIFACGGTSRVTRRS